MATTIKTQAEARRQFWQYLKEVDPALFSQGKRSKRQNQQITDIRCMFVEWLNNLYQDRQITEKQVNNYTL